MVKFEYTEFEDSFTEWIETDSDRIVPANTMTKNPRRAIAAEIDRNLTLKS